MSRNKNTPEQLDFLRAGYRTMAIRELTAAFNAQFGEERTEKNLKTTLGNHRIAAGRSGHFEKGSQPWNKGVKGYMGANATIK
ncbi:MAG: hypothetical protein ACYC9M_02860 [Desulfobulbaceae bacterium]